MTKTGVNILMSPSIKATSLPSSTMINQISNPTMSMAASMLMILTMSSQVFTSIL